MFGVEMEIILRPYKGKRTKVKYTDLPLDRQVQQYRWFKEYYDTYIQRTLK